MSDNINYIQPHSDLESLEIRAKKIKLIEQSMKCEHLSINAKVAQAIAEIVRCGVSAIYTKIDGQQGVKIYEVSDFKNRSNLHKR